MSEEPLRVVVVGAGIAGLAAAVLLSQVPSLSVEVYERSPVPREVGGWLGITPNAEAIISSQLSSVNELEKVVSRDQTPTARHWKTGREIFPASEGEIGAKATVEGNASCTRRDLHGLLLTRAEELIPIYGGKKALGAHLAKDSVGVMFDDGEIVPADLLIVADGIRSHIRESLGLRGDVKFSGVVEYMEVFDKALIVDLPDLPSGPSFFTDGDCWCWMSDVGKERFGIIISTIEDQSTAGRLQWAQDGGLERVRLLRNMFSTWCPIVRGVLARMTTISVYPVYRGDWLSSLSVGGRVALIGDAAHPTGGAYSAGAGLGICDVKALCLALESQQRSGGSLHDPSHLARALALYSATRGPMLQRVFSSIRADDVSRSEARKISDQVKRLEMWANQAGVVNLSWLRYHDVEVAFKDVLRGTSAARL